MLLRLSGLVILSAAMAAPQTVRPMPSTPDAQGRVPVYEVSVVERQIPAVNFRVLGGKTSLTLVGTPLLPLATGQADVQIERGDTALLINVDHVTPAKHFGPEQLTYVLWAVTPEGRPVNLGEVMLNGESATFRTTTTLQNFGLIVTAEPYFAVTRPSDLVVMEGRVTPDTKGQQSAVLAKYELLRRGSYAVSAPGGAATPLPLDLTVPLDYYEAQNAVRIAAWAHADEQAPDIYQRAQREMNEAQARLERHASRGEIATAARAAVQSAEDARLLTLQRDRQAALASADQRAQDATADASSAQQQAAAAAQAQQEAEHEAQAASQVASDAEAREHAAERAADAARAAESSERGRLLAALNTVAATRDTARGLIMSMPDVLFATNRAELRPDAQVKLAKMAGILLAYPGLQLQINGYTDNTGTVEYNQALSQQRAAAVRDFLDTQGVNPAAMSVQGLGEAQPVAPNDTALGRQQNRRVEVVVNGAAIGVSPQR